MNQKETAVSRIREFNRFYLPALNLLGNRYLDSEYSAAEARVLYEIYVNDGCNAAHIARTMNLDKSYLSRVIKRHEKDGYLRRTPSPEDSRSFELHLTDAGREIAEDFIQRSNLQIGALLTSLDEEQCARLVDALNTVTDILENCIKRRQHL